MEREASNFPGEKKNEKPIIECNLTKIQTYVITFLIEISCSFAIVIAYRTTCARGVNGRAKNKKRKRIYTKSSLINETKESKNRCDALTNSIQ